METTKVNMLTRKSPEVLSRSNV